MEQQTRMCGHSSHWCLMGRDWRDMEMESRNLIKVEVAPHRGLWAMVLLWLAGSTQASELKEMPQRIVMDIVDPFPYLSPVEKRYSYESTQKQGRVAIIGVPWEHNSLFLFCQLLDNIPLDGKPHYMYMFSLCAGSSRQPEDGWAVLLEQSSHWGRSQCSHEPWNVNTATTWTDAWAAQG